MSRRPKYDDPPKPSNTKARWKTCRLLRLGYRFATRNADGRIWFYWYQPHGAYDSCCLTIEIDEQSYQSVARFRLGDSDVHLARYLLLGSEDGWRRLAEFRTLYERLRFALVVNVHEQAQGATTVRGEGR